MTYKEKILAEIERHIGLICTPEGIVQRDKLQEYETLRDFGDYINSLQDEPTEDTLLDAEIWEWLKAHGTEETKQIIMMTARHFAEWQKEQDRGTIELAEDHAMFAGMMKEREQMLKDVIEGIARPDDCEIWVNLKECGYNYKDGDKVKLIIIKEEEK